MERTHSSLPSSVLSSAGHIVSLGTLSRLLALLFVVCVTVLAFTPWQQSIRGSGRVIAYAPLERQQAVEAPIDGRVTHWHVEEGQRIKKGDPIADLADNDPAILDRLGRERDATDTQVGAAELSIVLTEARVTSLEAARDSAIAHAEQRVSMAEDRLVAAERAIDAAKAAKKTAALNLTRNERLFERGLVSKRDLELAELEGETSNNELERARATKRAAKSEVKAYRAEREKVARTSQATVESTQSSLEKLRGEKAKAEAELLKVEVRLARQEQMRIVAPRDGTIFRLTANQGTEMVKAGDPLVLLVPETGTRAVELYVDGNDAPLVEEGRIVRLQFEGWPALQFVGWPSVAVGTFPGRIAFVDSHADDRGRFRVVVLPTDQDDWPHGGYLRQGVRANGWVLLDRVSLGFELWRQFNGFPPSVQSPEGHKADTTPILAEAK
jgi:multidrug resistance efflux pump